MNLNGKLLDTEVTPGVLHNIIYMTPATLSKVIGETPSIQETVMTVGDNNAPPATKSHRQVLESHEMTELDGRNLKLLHTLGKACQSVSSAKGSLMLDSPSFQISVATDDNFMELEKASNYLPCTSDPQINLRVEKRDPDENRNHRVSQPHPDDPDPREYFRRVIMPLISRPKESHVGARNFPGEVEESDESSGEKTCRSQSQAEDVVVSHSPEATKTLPLGIALEYQRLLGAVVPSTTPGPHLHLGLDMFTRTTSPLRRYSDLLAHWQIEAALLEEARLGQSLIGSTREDYLPFKKDELDRFIPFLDRREKDLLSWQRDAQRVSAMQLLLRAWKFNEAPLPDTFELWTHTIESKTIRGDLTYFGGLSAMFDLPSWLREEDVQIGDVFEVKLADLDIYNKRIGVEPLRRVRRTAESNIIAARKAAA
jgi:RNB domain